MSHADHEWAKEQIAAHLAGGLSADERARLETHTASCAECIAEIDAARRFDRQMDDLFTPIRPKAGLEERVIRVLRCAPPQKTRSMASRLILAAAAVVLMGVLGFVIIQVDEGGMTLLEGIGKKTEEDAVQKARSTPAPMASATASPRFWTDPNLGIGGLPPLDGVPSSGRGRVGGSFERKESMAGELASADQLAKIREERERAVFAFAKDKESDHNESLDDATKTRGESAVERGSRVTQGGDNLRGRGPMNAPMKTPPAAPGPVESPALALNSVLVLQERRADMDKNQVYSFRDESPAQNKADPGYYKPGDAAAAHTAKQPASELAKAEGSAGKSGTNGLGRANEFKEAKQQQLGAQGQVTPQGGAGQEQPPAPVQPAQRKIIRTGEVEYEIESFDSSVATISKLVEEEAGFIGTVNSDKLPNGKVRGTVVVRIPPERLDTLLLKLRGLGELKSQNIRSQDVGKQYYDLESRLKAARTMETRLLDIIAKGKGEIKDLLLAEKELGEWRTKIESYEGEKRYYDNQIGLSTLTITLSEKEIRAPFAVTQIERVNLGLEVEDVEKAHKDALAAVAEAKGRVTKSDLKQLAAGQYTATLHFEVAPDASGPLRDRFKQLGNVARLDIDRVQETEGGSGKVAEILKVKQKDTQFFVSIYNLANIAPRETVVLSLACADAEASYKTILARVEKAAGRVVTSSLNRQKNDQTTGTLRFEIKSADAEAVLSDIRQAGEVMRLDVSENPDTQNVTKSKRGFQVQLFAMGLVEPRETLTIQVAAKDVPKAYRDLQESIGAAEAHILGSQLNENDRQNVTASLSFDVRKESYAKIDAALLAAGEVMNRNSTRAQEIERVVDSKKRYILTLVNLASIPIRETYTIAVEVDPVDSAVSALEKMASEVKGRIVDSRHTRGAGGRNVSKVTIDLPLSSARGAADQVKALGMLRVFDTTRNPQAPEGDLAVGRLEVTLSNPQQLVDVESGPWTRIKSGLSVGLTALSWSLTLVVVGLCFILPVGAIGWAGMKIYRRSKPKAA
jgi:hypothetical protein